MPFTKEIEVCLERIRSLEKSFLEVKDKESFPIEFFTESRDSLSLIEKRVTEMEKKQNVSVSPVFLNEDLSKKIHKNLRTLLSLNDRFRFQRDLFGNNGEEMNLTLEHLDSLSSIEEALLYLKNKWEWNWEDDSVIAFREMLEIRF